MISVTVARRRFAKAFTLVELLVVIGIITVLIALLMPALRQARDEADAIRCRSNLRQLSLAVMMYANEHDGYLPGPCGIINPPGWDWSPSSTPGISVEDQRPTATGWLATTGVLKEARVWLCAADPRLPLGVTFSYSYNARMIAKPGWDAADDPPLLASPWLRRIATFREPSRDIMFVEENTSLSRPWPIDNAFFIYDNVTDARHGRQAQVGYLDGHSDQIPANVALFHDRRYFCR